MEAGSCDPAFHLSLSWANDIDLHSLEGGTIVGSKDNKSRKSVFPDS